VLGDELPAETVQPITECTPEELEKEILSETLALPQNCRQKVFNRGALRLCVGA